MSSMTRRLKNIVYVLPFLSETDGDATYGSQVSYPCHIDYAVSRVLNARGDEVTSIATIYLEAEVTPRDKFILPDVQTPLTAGGGTAYDRALRALSSAELDNISRTAIKVVRVYDPRKGGEFHHCEVML